MAALWELGEATVTTRAHQRGSDRKAYTTIQTVLNRLVERGLVERERRGKPYVYRPRYDEPELLARSMQHRLNRMSVESRRGALLGLVDGLTPDDLDQLVRYLRDVRRRRREHAG